MISGLKKYAIIKVHESNRNKVKYSVKFKYEIGEYDLSFIEEVYEKFSL